MINAKFRNIAMVGLLSSIIFVIYLLKSDWVHSFDRDDRLSTCR